jgi:hypothetical protein
LAIIEYHKLFTAYYPKSLPIQATSSLKTSPTPGEGSAMAKVSVVVVSNNFVPPTLPDGETPEQLAASFKAMKEKCSELLELFIFPGSSKEINVSSMQRKLLMAELKNETYHPEIWKGVFEQTANTLRCNSLPRFLKTKK